MDTILVVNAGSSSVKFQVFAIEGKASLKRLIRGQIEGVGARPLLRAHSTDGQPLVDQAFDTADIPDVPTALAAAGNWLRTQDIEPVAVGHRVVHGGPDYSGPILASKAVLMRLERYIPLAPLHQPNNLAPIRSILERFPALPQVACFDTAFHRGHSAVAERYAIPERFYDEGVRRYGFHGLSYEYVAGRLREVAPEIAADRVIVAHLGSGASMCALQGGRSIESTMGFTALDGLPMSTRPGQIDPGVILYLAQRDGMTAAALEALLYQNCGLKGISGISNDMRDLEASSHPSAKLAIDYFTYRVALYTGMLAAALNGVDAFVFTAGIGEHSKIIRATITEKLSWLGAELDAAANAQTRLVISTKASRISLFVIPTDEELMIARHTLALTSEVQGQTTTVEAS